MATTPSQRGLGFPAVTEPRSFDLRSVQTTVQQVRERLRVIDAALTTLQNATGANQLSATLAQLQQQVNLLQRRLTAVENSLGPDDTTTLIALTDMPVGAPVVPSGTTSCRMVDPNDPEAVFACVGLVTAAVAQGQAAVIQRRGNFTLAGSGFDPGREVYASIGGDLTQQPTYGAAAVPVGIATSADTLYVTTGGPALLALGLDDNAYERFMYASVELVSDAIALAAQVDAAANGLVTKTADGSVTTRVLQGTTNRVTVTNGDGVVGDPVVDISASYAGQASIATLGTILTGVWQATPVGIAFGGSGQSTANAALNAFLPDQTLNAGKALFTDGANSSWGAVTTGTVTSVGVAGNNGIGVSGSPITSSGTITLSLGAITPSSVAAGGTVTGSNLSGTNTGDQTITLTGDVTGSGTGSFAATLATVNSNVGSFGSSTAIPTFTVNAKGLITAASTNAVVAPAGTLTGTTLAANVVSSSLTSLGTIATGVWQGTAIGVAYGGTGIASYTVGDLLYASASTTLSKLADVATGNVLLSGGVATAPAWGKVDLTAHVTGILPGANGGTGNGFFAVSGPATSLKTFTFPNASATVLTDNAAVTVAQGGTGITSGTSGGIPYFSGSTTIASSGALTANRLVLGGGAGAAPTVLGSLGTTTTVLHGNAAGAPTFGAVSLTADVTGTLPVANGGTGVTALSSLTADPSASVGLSAANGSASTFMRSDAAPALSQSITPTWTATHTFSKSGGGTSSALFLSSIAPSTSWNETDAAADNRLWDMLANSEQFMARAVNDANSVATNWVTVDRTGTTIDQVAFPNGNVAFDTNTLFVDAANNRVGIRNSSPAVGLHLSAADVQVDNAVLQFGGTGSAAASNPCLFRVGGNDNLAIATGGSERLRIESTGATRPGANNTYDLGLTGTRWATVYTTSININSTTMLTANTALTNGAAAATGTLTNAPAAGNPTKWVPINDAGTTRYIPAW